MVDVTRDQLKIKVKIDASWLLHVLSSRGLMLSGPTALFLSSLVRARLVSCSMCDDKRWVMVVTWEWDRGRGIFPVKPRIELVEFICLLEVNPAKPGLA
ncbi:hypothetical protein ElyMa_006887300 [Elysia marginata]|uniref:Uncharacterized protein n=1 Tax=Elysia marginata TaxID=1093978 RepID=A0AAV4JG39_9GAST|nr:hypothetical protein ElyMa_006887300 [Elysia marginata]